MAVGSFPHFESRDSIQPPSFSIAEWAENKEKENYKLERNKLLFDVALQVFIHYHGKDVDTGWSFDIAEKFVEEYERRVKS